jgi:Ring finger domain
MDVLLKLVTKNYMNISRFAFQTHPDGHRLFQDLDELLTQKDNFIDYVKFEYTTTIIYNFIVSLPSLFYVLNRFKIIFPCDPFSTIWLFLVSFIKVLELIPKLVLVIQTIRIGNNSNDSTIASRRLMYMTRSNIFFFNTILGYLILILYTIFFLFVRKSSMCEKAPQFYFIINWLIFGFFLRLVISFVNYFLHFKYGVNEADLENANFYKDYNNRVCKDVLDMIESVELNEENINQLVTLNDCGERDFCCICMLQFEIGENIKLLPCNKKHIFHNACIDKWLSHNKNCPTCRKEINKKLFNKNKFY